MGSYLGDDLVMAILSGLPGKDLVRCKCLSKSFHTLISNFISQNPTLSMSNLLYEFYEGGCLPQPEWRYARPLQEKEENEKHVISNINNVNEHITSYNLEDCQNGLLLFVHKITNIHGVWNPFINKWFACPPPPPIKLGFEPSFGCISILAFDPRISPHYKVIRLLEWGNSPDQKIRVDIFSSETGLHCWFRCEGRELSGDLIA
ncbi:F-box protein At5g07610-like [Tasmannia lanceolata]|uniref:F-box protein At5g07610-like n=1 Tax=Tasmannia lanceolata TaxID=3420 RepID=UPI0040640C28